MWSELQYMLPDQSGVPPPPPCQDRRISSREKSGSIIFFWLCLAPWLALLFSSVPLEFGALKRWDNLKGRKPEVDKGIYSEIDHDT